MSKTTLWTAISLFFAVNAFGQQLVKDINPEGSSSPKELVACDGWLYFIAKAGTFGEELWKSDGTADGTVMVKDINTTPEFGGNLQFLTDVNGTLFFSASDVGYSNSELWKSDGTAEGTVMVKEIRADEFDSEPMMLTNFNGTLFFTANDGVHGRELWKSDGTYEGTVMVKDIDPGFSDSWPEMLTVVDGMLYFIANGDELYKSDGTPEGTVLVKDVHPGPSVLRFLTNVDGRLFFSGGVGGAQLWTSDGTENGTIMIANIGAGDVSAAVENFIGMNGVLYFTTNDGTHGGELWRSDGTPEGTMMVKDINPGEGNSYADNFVAIGDTLFFSAYDGTHSELWKSDGTAGGTMMVKDIWPGGSSAVGNTFNYNNTLFFLANDGGGFHVWKSDGTEEGTTIAWEEDILFSLAAVEGVYLRSTVAIVDNIWYFSSTPSAAVGKELFKYGGETASVKNFEDALGLVIYPNPTSGRVSIVSNSLEEADVTLYNTSGQTLYNAKINGNQDIDLSGFADGIYYVNFKTQGGSVSKKVVLTR